MLTQNKPSKEASRISGKQWEFYENDAVPDEETQALIADEIAHAPSVPQELLDRLSDNTASSPADSGGDIDASWEDVDDSGAETVFGHNPTPDQSDVEENAHAMGIDYEDNEPLDLLEKIEKRDRDRYELNENSKSDRDTI